MLSNGIFVGALFRRDEIMSDSRYLPTTARTILRDTSADNVASRFCPSFEVPQNIPLFFIVHNTVLSVRLSGLPLLALLKTVEVGTVCLGCGVDRS